MQFIYPQILWALLALAIPVIIHLFHFRRFKKVYFTNVRFLKEIKEEKSTRRRLRNLLVLMSRILAFCFLVFAFAQPYISENESAKLGKNNVSIFIDNSFSMMSDSDDVPLLANAKKKAEEIISAYDLNDQFQILSHELRSGQQRWIEKENTIQALEELEFSPEVNQLNTVLQKQMQSRPDGANHIIYLLSDFQKSISDFEISIDSSQELNLVVLQSIKENNISIDSAWFESVVPALNQNNRLFVRLSNHSEEDREDIRLEMVHNGQTRPEGTVDIKAKSTKIDTINLLVSQSGWQELELRVEDYPVQFDDSYFLSFNVQDKIDVLSIRNENQNQFVPSVFRSINNFKFERMDPGAIQYDRLKEFALIILEDIPSISSGLASELRSYVDQGGNLLVFPSANADLETYNRFFELLKVNTIQGWTQSVKSVYRINTAEFVFENVFSDVDRNMNLPETRGHFTFNNFSDRASEYLLKYRDGSDYINKYQRGKGNVFVSSSPINQEYNDLVLNAEVFVPLLYKVAFSASQTEKMSYTIGQDNFTEINSTSNSEDIIYRIKAREEFIPGQQNMGNSTLLNFNNMIEDEGFYKVSLQDEHIKTLAFNFDRLESILDYYSPAELNQRYGDFSKVLENSLDQDLTHIIKEKDKGVTFWKWCLILALIFLALETLLLRVWKV